MRELFVDFETYYDEKAKYSLKYMTTLEYVRDPRFKILGASVAYGDHAAMWIDNIETLRAVLKQAAERDVIFVGHNAAFDACAAYEGLGVRFKRYRCTMLMARYLISQNILPPESGTALRDLAPMVDMEKGHLDEALASGEVDKYCNLDVEICRALYNKYADKVPEIEWTFMSMHIDCSAVAKFDLDIPLLKETAEKAKAREHLFPVVRKDDALTALLEKRGVKVEMKRTPKGNEKPAFAKTDAFMKGLLEHPDPVVKQLAELRLEAYSTNERNKAQRFLDAGSPLACPLLYYAAHTGRSGGRDYNVQNMKRGGACRVALRAMPGKKLIIIDSSQVEVRTLAWLAHEEVLLNTFRRGGDVYKAFAGNYLFRKPIDEVTKEERQIAKPAVLALGFGQGVTGLIAYAKNYGVDLSDEMAARCVSVYRETFTAITGGRFKHKDGLWQREFAFALANGYTELPTKRRLYYPGLRKDGDEYVFTKHTIFLRDTVYPRLWPGLVIENCLAVDTLVLTDEGFKILQDVEKGDRVFDGEEFVESDGFISRGVKPVICKGGIVATPDHKFLVKGAWKEFKYVKCGAARETGERTIRDRARGLRIGTTSRSTTSIWKAGETGRILGRSLCEMWCRKARSANRLSLRGYNKVSRLLCPKKAEERGFLARCLAVYGFKMYLAVAQSLEKLRWPWNNLLRPMAEIRKLQERCRIPISERTRYGSNRQRKGLLSGKHPLCSEGGKLQQQKEVVSASIWRRVANYLRVCKEKWREAVNRLLAGKARVHKVQEVGDILNCGPRHQFAVFGKNGECYIVHNCVQATARDLVFGQVADILAKYPQADLCLLVHDEAVLSVPEADAEEIMAYAEEAFKMPPAWAPDIPVKGEGHISDRYDK